MAKKIRKRPLLITFICIIGYAWIVITFPAIFSPSIKKLGDWMPALLGLITSLSFISFVGIWYMKKWGVDLFVATFFLKQIIDILIHDISKIGIGLSVVFIVCLLFFYRKMDVNL